MARILTEEQKQRKRIREAERRQNPEYVEAKRMRTAERMADPEVRERKRQKDRERWLRIKGSPEMIARRREIHAKHRETEKYTSYQKAILDADREKTKQRRSDRLRKSVGATCPIMPRTCECCNVVYVARMDGAMALAHKYCKRCSRKNTMTGKRHTPKYRGCKRCGDVFKGLAGAKYCSTCAEDVAKDIKRNIGRGFRKRAAYYGCYYEPVNRARIYERDGYRCYICGCAVVVSDKWRPDMATLDHIIPLSRGGAHVHSNVKTCCSACNSSKSDKIYDQTMTSQHRNAVSVR